MRCGPATLVGQPHVTSGTHCYRPLADDQSLLLIILDDLRRANLCVVRVKPDIAKSTSLTQEVPALVQFDLDLHEPFTIGLGVCP
jgi:hypothetical protein